MKFFDKFNRKQKQEEPKESTESQQDQVFIDLDQVFKEVPHPDPYSITEPDLYPFGAPHYSQKASENDASYMYQHTIVCPVCHQSFTFPALATSRLSLKCIDHDLRKHYKDLDPLWYRVCHCPHCYYTALSEQFEENPDTLSHVEDVISGLSVFKDANVLSFTEPRTINQVITSLYLALMWAQFGDSTYAIRAKLWLYLSWLYQDLEEEELYIKTTEKALEYYRRMYYTSRHELDPYVEQTCFLVIAELFIRLGDLPHAYDSLIHVIAIKNGKRLYKTDAQNRLSDVQEMRKEAKKQ